MDITEAYRQAEVYLYNSSPRLALRVEKEARDKGLPLIWLCAAGAYARKGDKRKFAEALQNAALSSDDEAVHTLASNVEQTFSMIHKDSQIVQHARQIFAEQIKGHFSYKYTVEDIIKRLQEMPPIQTSNSVKLEVTNLLFEAYVLRTPEEQEAYAKRVETLTRHSIRISDGKDNDIGWIFGII